jgi:8-oxo-dGTP diphosphatase
MNVMPEIRNAARAMIVRDGKVLLLRKLGGGRSERFSVPGGGQKPGETLIQTVLRECDEEIGAKVEVGQLIHVVDFFKIKTTQPEQHCHVVEFLFQCQIADDYVPKNGARPDKHQVEVLWMDCSALSGLVLSPNYLSECIKPEGPQLSQYLGTFHDDPAS